MSRSKAPLVDTLEGARQRALRLLTRREHSAHELHLKLRSHGVPDDLADAVVEDFAARGWQSDARYAEMLIRTRIDHAYGPLRIKAELAAAGVDDAVSMVGLDTAACDWVALARRASRRRYDGQPEDAAQWQKCYRFLAQRGFTAEQIHAALRAPPESQAVAP